MKKTSTMIPKEENRRRASSNTHERMCAPVMDAVPERLKPGRKITPRMRPEKTS